MSTLAAFDQHCGALVDGQFALLEHADIGKLLLLEFPEHRQWPKRADLAWVLTAGKRTTILARHFDPSFESLLPETECYALQGRGSAADGMSFLNDRMANSDHDSLHST